MDRGSDHFVFSSYVQSFGLVRHCYLLACFCVCLDVGCLHPNLQRPCVCLLCLYPLNYSFSANIILKLSKNNISGLHLIILINQRNEICVYSENSNMITHAENW